MTKEFKTGEEAIYIKMGKDDFMAQVIPCFIYHNLVRGANNPVYEVILRNGQQIEAFQSDLYTEIEARKKLKKYMSTKFNYMK